MTVKPRSPSQAAGRGRPPLEAPTEAGHRDSLAETFPVNSVQPVKQMQAMAGLSLVHQSAIC